MRSIRRKRVSRSDMLSSQLERPVREGRLRPGHPQNGPSPRRAEVLPAKYRDRSVWLEKIICGGKSGAAYRRATKYRTQIELRITTPISTPRMSMPRIAGLRSLGSTSSLCGSKMLLELYEKPRPEDRYEHNRYGEGNLLGTFEWTGQRVLKGIDRSKKSYRSCSNRPLLLLRKTKLF